MNNIKKTIKNLKNILSKNRSKILYLLVSEDFMLRIKERSELLKIEEYEEGKYSLFDVPLKFSNMLKEGAVFEMSDGEFIVLKGI